MSNHITSWITAVCTVLLVIIAYLGLEEARVAFRLDQAEERAAEAEQRATRYEDEINVSRVEIERLRDQTTNAGQQLKLANAELARVADKLSSMQEQSEHLKLAFKQSENRAWGYACGEFTQRASSYQFTGEMAGLSYHYASLDWVEWVEPYKGKRNFEEFLDDTIKFSVIPDAGLNYFKGKEFLRLRPTGIVYMNNALLSDFIALLNPARKLRFEGFVNSFVEQHRGELSNPLNFDFDLMKSDDKEAADKEAERAKEANADFQRLLRVFRTECEDVAETR